MSDEGLDNLFKKGLSGRNVKFNMASWRAMEQMLPPEPKAAAFSMSAAAAVVGILLLVSASIFVWTKSDSNGQLKGANYGISETTLGTENGSGSIESNEFLGSGSKNGNPSNSSDENQINPATQNGQKNQRGAENASLVDGNNNSLSSLGSEAATSPSSREIGNSNASGTNENQSASGPKRLSNGSKNKFFAQNSGFKSMTETSSASSSRVSEMEQNETKITLGNNAFTQIIGIGELSSLNNQEDETILFANVDENNLPTVNKNVFGFIGGINVNKSLTDNPGNGIAGSEFFGLTYQRYLKGGLSIRTNLLYSARNEVNTKKTYDVKVYDFGSKTEQTTVESQRLIYLELPVMVNYGFGNHNVMGGASVSYLVSSLNKVTTNYTSLIEGESSSEKSEWGYKNGFKSYDVALVAGYEYNVNPKLNVGMRLNYGLIDVTNNTYFGVDSFDNNVQVRVYLIFSPFQF